MGKNQLISFLQVWGILLVVVGHSFYGYTMQGSGICQIERWIYMFHMPLFMFISGWLLRYGNVHKAISISGMTWRQMWQFVVKKARRLLLPYVVISSLVFPIKILLSQYAARPIDGSWLSYANMLICPWDNAIAFFWFLPTLFIVFLAVVVGAKLLRAIHLRHIPVAVMAVLLLLNISTHDRSSMPLNLEGVAHYMPFFAAGYYCCQYGVEQMIGRRPAVVFLVTFALSVAALFAPEFPGSRLLWALNGIAMSIALGHIYLARGWGFFKPFYGASYTIYLFSWFPQVASQQVLLSFFDAPRWIPTILSITTGFLVPWCIYLVARRWRGTWLGTLCGV